MTSTGKHERQVSGLLQHAADSVEATRKDLNDALDRFVNGELIRLNPGSKLTLRNLATESGHSKDTPLRKYPKDDPRHGQYVYPDIASRYKKLTKKKEGAKGKESEIQRLRSDNNELKGQVTKLARTINEQDTKIVEVTQRKEELEEENARLRAENADLRREGLIVMPMARSEVRGGADESRG